jgi:hypothetical protein
MSQYLLLYTNELDERLPFVQYFVSIFHIAATGLSTALAASRTRYRHLSYTGKDTSRRTSERDLRASFGPYILVQKYQIHHRRTQQHEDRERTTRRPWNFYKLLVFWKHVADTILAQVEIFVETWSLLHAINSKRGCSGRIFIYQWIIGLASSVVEASRQALCSLYYHLKFTIVDEEVQIVEFDALEDKVLRERSASPIQLDDVHSRKFS